MFEGACRIFCEKCPKIWKEGKWDEKTEVQSFGLIIRCHCLFFVVPSVRAEDTDNLFYDNGDYFILKRLYNSSTGEHRYGIYKSEVQGRLNKGWRLERGSLYIYKKVYKPTNSVKVHCMVNTKTQSGLYTVNDNEKDMLLNQNSKNPHVMPKWTLSVSESFQTVPANQGIPVYRLYNPNSWRGTHHFTPIQAEKDMLVRLGWRYEGIGFYVSGVLNE